MYGLPDLAGAKRVYVSEGEKAADAARSIGLTATTSAHGCESPDKTDWSPLAGKECIILPDHDAPGGKYADAVAAILAKLTPAPVVKVVELPDLPDHGDMADWVEARRGYRRRRAAADRSKPWPTKPSRSERPAARIERSNVSPFPADALPEPIRGFVAAGAKAIGCDPSYLALPMLTGPGGGDRQHTANPTETRLVRAGDHLDRDRGRKRHIENAGIQAGDAADA